ncbi:HIT domain-containing protein [Candidatus Saccharibacteria bacterium]|nr:HIT domain-containing protein [Candidatus Saccharibacteria bacterium]
MSSTFTQIINGEIPCYKIYEDAKTLAFLDIHPETPGHTLVIPKLEVDKIYDLPDDYFDALMHTVKKLSKHLEQKLGARILWKVVGTDVPHAHVHLTPYDPTWYHGRVVATTPEKFRELQFNLKLEEKHEIEKTDPFAPLTSREAEAEELNPSE